VKVILPISSRARSRPRTRMVSSFDVEIAELRWSCRPIFKLPPKHISHIERYVDIRNNSGLTLGPSSRLLLTPSDISDIEIDCVHGEG
jgi:hypothetical protein